MTVIEALYAYFASAPMLDGRRLDVDCLQSKPDMYSLDSIPGERIMKTYMDGSTVRRQLFTISSRSSYGPNLAQQGTNLGFFEELEDWVYEQVEHGHLPQLGDNRQVRSLRVVSTAYPVEANEGLGGGTARYQIQLELIYLQQLLSEQEENQ